MANFFTDNEDIKFLFKHMDLAQIAALQEDDFTRDSDIAGAPVDAEDAVDNYWRILEIVGEIAAERISPRSEQIDEEGNTLNDDATVTLHPLVAKNIEELGKADLMGFTLPRKYEGLNCPNIIYTMAIEMVSRADASLMNIFGLQGIAETIYAFANDEICAEFLPRFSRGEVTGAMVLTEPDAGSDLQAVKLKAFQDDSGNWYLRGVKRFITNGCGNVLLTLARSEPDTTDGRGLSLFVSERSDKIKIRHLEHKIGIHGSPTCEMVYDDVPARLVGERQLGLIRYVMALMNGARVGIAAQSLGIGEAAYRLARNYANSRKQFGGPIENLPAVAELITDMKIQLEAARALTYETSFVCDIENNNTRKLEMGLITGKDETKAAKQLGRQIKRINGMLTPMSKYFGSEMCNSVSNMGLQVLGGSGYMKDYPAERYVRDARITNIYEGTSQLQIVAAVRGVCSGAFEKRVNEYEKAEYNNETLANFKRQLVEAKAQVLDTIAFIKERGNEFMDLSGRRLVDAAIVVIVGHLFLKQASECDRKIKIATRYLEIELPKLKMNLEFIQTGSTMPISDYEVIAGPVPELA